MRPTWKDAATKVLMAAAATCFVGYMLRGSVPVDEDPATIAGLLIAGALAIAVGGWVAVRSAHGLAYATVGVGSVALVVGALALMSENLLDLAVRRGILVTLMTTVAGVSAVLLFHHARRDQQEAVQLRAGSGRGLPNSASRTPDAGCDRQHR
ncbi:MAG: hypothetical protein M3R48_03390 [Candidatus Dormibacteraeota bacterium]|nr:hypothetical protein [Candidatus Dormibacteraeota bacterium]